MKNSYKPYHMGNKISSKFFSSVTIQCFSFVTLNSVEVYGILRFSGIHRKSLALRVLLVRCVMSGLIEV